MITDRVAGARDSSPSFVGSAMIKVDALRSVTEDNFRLACLVIEESIFKFSLGSRESRLKMVLFECRLVHSILSFFLPNYYSSS